MSNNNSSELFIAITTCPNKEEAEKIAGILIEEALAACVNILPNLTSVYFWDNAIQKENEFLLFIKTSSEKILELETKLHEIHSYDIPEFVVLSAEKVSSGYLNWVKESCQRKK